MAEQSAFGTFKDTLAAVALRRGELCSYQRVEDKLTPGIPDANVCLGGREWWQENKHIRALPTRAGTAVKFDETLKPEQINWLENRQLAGGRAFVVVRVARVGWHIFDRDLRRLRDITRAEWDDLVCFKTSESLISHILTEIDNEYLFGRPLFRG